jgi:uncharacterized Zn finger protein
MYPSGERARCLRLVILQKEFACHNCGSGSFIIKSAQWSMTSPPALDVDLRCATCGTGATAPLTPQEARRCGFDEPI